MVAQTKQADSDIGKTRQNAAAVAAAYSLAGVALCYAMNELYFGEGEGVTEGEDVKFEQRRIGSRGFGILDVGYKSAGEVWAAGGSGSLFVSTNQGQSWKREKATDDLAANLYTVKFVNGGKNGFVLGNDGVLLRYLGA
jgi:photosystem II stability/assembly factor-like uncharacterized protein